MECLLDPLPHTGPQWTIVSMELSSWRVDVRTECGHLKQSLFLQVCNHPHSSCHCVQLCIYHACFGQCFFLPECPRQGLLHLATLCVTGAHNILLHCVLLVPSTSCYIVCYWCPQHLATLCVYGAHTILLHCVLQCCRARCHLVTLCVAVL